MKDATTTSTRSPAGAAVADKKTPSKKAQSNKQSTPTTPSIAPKVDEATTTTTPAATALPIPRATGPRDPTNPWGRK